MMPAGGDLDDNRKDAHHRGASGLEAVGVRVVPYLERIVEVRSPGPMRLAGIAAIVGWFAVSFAWFLSVTGGVVDHEVVVLPDLAVVAEEATSPTADDPTYLAFRSPMDSQVYAVDRLLRQGEAGQSAATDQAETDVFPPYSLAARSSIAPGLYATRFGIEECSFELRRLDDEGTEKVIGQDRVVGGRVMVTVHDIEPDVFDPAVSCGQWSEWSPLVRPLATATSGDYWRSDLRPGVWAVSRGCEWEKVVGFRGADLADVYDSGIGPGTLQVDEDMLGLRVRRCPTGLSWEQPLPLSDGD